MKNVNRRRKPYYKFKSFLVEHDIKQQELAKLLNKSKSAINQNLNGTGGDFSISELKVLKEAYNIKVDDYFF